MQRNWLSIFILLLVGFGCSSKFQNSALTSSSVNTDVEVLSEEVVIEPTVVSPLDPNGVVVYNPTYKRFGEYFEDRFRGYHTGEDSEVPPEDLAPGEVQLVPIRAIADGEVTYWSRVSGYGGVIIVKHEIDGKTISALYGHLDLGSSNLKTGDAVVKGQLLANLGADKSKDTDGERQHLHFALWEGDDIKLQGYVNSSAELDSWMNPWDFFKQYSSPSEYAATDDATTGEDWVSSWTLVYPEPLPIDHPAGRTAYHELEFEVPHGWDVEYIPSIEALNFYDASGTGSARERSQIFIRYFDANDFLTLSTVTIYSTEDLTVGDGYTARRYDIEKNDGVLDFKDQPGWRNTRHVVTDFRAHDGFSRFYVIAANPELDVAVYERVIESMRVNQ